MHPLVVFDEIYELIRKIRNCTFHGFHNGFGIMDTVINKNIDFIIAQNVPQVFVVIFILIKKMQFRHIVCKSPQVLQIADISVEILQINIETYNPSRFEQIAPYGQTRSP